MPEPDGFNLTSTGSFLIGQKTAFSIAAVADLDPRRLLHRTITLDGRVVRVLAVETHAVVNATGHPFALVVSPPMPEPDFEQIAAVLSDGRDFITFDHLRQGIAEQLRQVWNARGAADRAALGVEFKRAMAEGGGNIRPEEILKALDR